MLSSLSQTFRVLCRYFLTNKYFGVFLVFVSVRRRHKDLAKASMSVTRYFFEIMGTFGLKEYPKEFVACNATPENVIEVFRHSLCLALDLHSELNCVGLDDFCECMAIHLKDALVEYNLETEENKTALVQACVHCIVSTRNRVRGEDRQYGI